MKDIKKTERPNRDPGFAPAFEYGNRLQLSDEIKQYINGQGLDFRFLNAMEFRASGNYHRSQWVVFRCPEELSSKCGATAEGTIQRGDLILGVRPKTISAKHREFLKERNRRYSNFNKTEAQKLRQHARDTGLDGHVRVVEGDDEGEE